MSGGEGTATALCGCDVDVSRLIVEVPPPAPGAAQPLTAATLPVISFFIWLKFACQAEPRKGIVSAPSQESSLVEDSLRLFLFFLSRLLQHDHYTFFKFLYLIIYSIICDAGPFSIAKT